MTQLLASDCLARGSGANVSGAWHTVNQSIIKYARVRRVADCIARAVSIFTRFPNFCAIVTLRFLRKKAAKEEEVPGLGRKNELRVQHPSGANRYPSTVEDYRAVTSLRLTLLSSDKKL